MSRKIVFFDIDGVLNRTAKSFKPFVDPELAERLFSIAEATDAGLVVHSSWRYTMSLEEIRSHFEAHIAAKITDEAPKMEVELKMSGIYVLPKSGEAFFNGAPSRDERGVAIWKWLQANPDVGPEDFIIFDDLPDVRPYLGTENFIQTDPSAGLTEAQAAQAIEFLGCALQPSFKHTFTQRGFGRIEFIDRYGDECSVQESSLATERCIWLGISDAKPQICTPGKGWSEVPLPEGTFIGSRMHLTQGMAAELIPILQHFVETGDLPRAPENNPCP
ncbi:MAG: hypothetical protein GY871_04395 [Actinomycetales bacterium]|nr:hypothetical protein [Actinomycetales bacterium]